MAGNQTDPIPPLGVVHLVDDDNTPDYTAVLSTWVCAVLCSIALGASGIIPVLFVESFRGQQPQFGQDDDDSRKRTGSKSDRDQSDHFPAAGDPSNNSNGLMFRLMLSFAVGGLLGDVFLHLLPEAYSRAARSMVRPGQKDCCGAEDGALVLDPGVWVLVGMLTFLLVEKIACSRRSGPEGSPTARGGQGPADVVASAGIRSSGSGSDLLDGPTGRVRVVDVSGYLNLAANCMDNFSHGLAIGGAFMVSVRVGIVTTACILAHEIPHEFGDFAILVRAGFDPAEAVRAQLLTSSVGVCGAMAALAVDAVWPLQGFTSWILPFTCGGFLNIALVTVLPDLLDSRDFPDFFSVMTGVSLGVFSVYQLSAF